MCPFFLAFLMLCGAAGYSQTKTSLDTVVCKQLEQEYAAFLHENKAVQAFIQETVQAAKDINDPKERALFIKNACQQFLASITNYQ